MQEAIRPPHVLCKARIYMSGFKFYYFALTAPRDENGEVSEQDAILYGEKLDEVNTQCQSASETLTPEEIQEQLDAAMEVAYSYFHGARSAS